MTANNMILDRDGSPFPDIALANQVAAVLSRETGRPYVVARHDTGGYGLLRDQSSQGWDEVRSDRPSSNAMPEFDEIRFRPAWRSQLGKVFSILIGLAIFFFSDALIVLFHIDRLLALLQSQGLLAQPMIGSVISRVLSLMGFVYAGVAAAKALYFIYSHDYFIGPRGIEKNEGLFSKDQSRIEFKHIRGVNLRQSVFERLLGIGTIDIATSGSELSEVRFAGITNPKRVLETLRDRLKAMA